jgi:hypothetical protein
MLRPLSLPFGTDAGFRQSTAGSTGNFLRIVRAGGSLPITANAIWETTAAMTDINDENQEDKPLDPVMEGVRRKMVKLQLISGGIMAVLFLAVLVSIVYKLTREEGGAQPVAASAPSLAVPSDQPLSLTANLPAGFRVTQTSLSGSQMLIYGETAAGERKAFVFDLALGRIIADVTLAGD